jgi:transcription elongation factor SPT6
VEERDKKTETSIGSKLIIKDEVYGDIDELIARHIDTMNDFVLELRKSPKFRDLSKDEIDKELRKEKAVSPKKIPYLIAFDEANPGHLLLRFLPGTTVKGDLVSITPNGFKYKGKDFTNLGLMFDHFKANCMKKPEKPKPAARSSRWVSGPAAPSTAPPPYNNYGMPPSGMPPSGMPPSGMPPSGMPPSGWPPSGFPPGNMPPPPVPAGGNHWGHHPSHIQPPPPSYNQPPPFQAAPGYSDYRQEEGWNQGHGHGHDYHRNDGYNVQYNQQNYHQQPPPHYQQNQYRQYDGQGNRR